MASTRCFHGINIRGTEGGGIGFDGADLFLWGHDLTCTGITR